MRTISPILADALANQKGELILRALTWSDQTDYKANPTTPDHTWAVKAFDIYSTSANAELVTENDYIASAFTVFIIERGVKVEGVEYTVKSGLYFVRKYNEDYGTIKIQGSSYPNKKISIAANKTYKQTIEAFCVAIGKTAVFKNTADKWLPYKFLPDGKPLSLNKAEQFESLLKQKYTILVYEESPNNLVFYYQDSYIRIFPYTVAWSPELGLFCVLSELGADEILTSTNGIDWDTGFAPEPNSWSSIAWSPALELFCAVATTGTHQVMTSPNGINWTLQTASAVSNWSSVAWSPELGIFCAVAYGPTSRVMTSPDGINWTTRTAAEANPWVEIVWSSELGLFCAVAQTGTHRVMTSPNGITWTARTAAEVNPWASIAWSPELGLFCSIAIGTDRAMTSPDGINWTARTTTEANSWSSIAWSPKLGLFCAVAFTGTNRVMTSPDGINWTTRTAAAASNWYTVRWSPELGIFCAIAGSINSGDKVIMTSPDGINWAAQASDVNFNLNYEDGPRSYIDRQHSEVHFIWRDQTGLLHTEGDTSMPQWNLGFLHSTATAPITREDAYYKIFLQKAPVSLEITDGDKIHFRPSWSIDPTKTIDAMMQVSEHLNLKESPAWYQEIRSIALFYSTEGGTMPHAIAQVGAYTPLISTGFDGNLDDSVNNMQALAQAVNDMPVGDIAPTTSAINDVQFGDGAGNWITKNLAQAKIIFDIFADAASDSVYYVRRNAAWTNLKTYTDTLYSIIGHTHKQIILLGSALEDGTLAAGAASTAKPFRSGLGSGFNVAIPVAGTLKNLYFRTGGAQPASGTLTCTLNVNNSQKTIVATCPAGSAAATFTDTTHTYALTAGDVIWFDLKNNATATSAPLVSVVIILEFNTA